jgi:hypothetical protein
MFWTARRKCCTRLEARTERCIVAVFRRAARVRSGHALGKSAAACDRRGNRHPADCRGTGCPQDFAAAGEI